MVSYQTVSYQTVSYYSISGSKNLHRSPLLTIFVSDDRNPSYVYANASLRCII